MFVCVLSYIFVFLFVFPLLLSTVSKVCQCAFIIQRYAWMEWIIIHYSVESIIRIVKQDVFSVCLWVSALKYRYILHNIWLREDVGMWVASIQIHGYCPIWAFRVSRLRQPSISISYQISNQINLQFIHIHMFFSMQKCFAFGFTVPNCSISYYVLTYVVWTFCLLSFHDLLTSSDFSVCFHLFVVLVVLFSILLVWQILLPL